MKTGLYPIWRGLVLCWWKRALKEMGGDHPDAPRAVLRIHELENS